MAIYPKMTITELGKNLYAKAQSGTAITYTRMRIGSGSYNGDPAVLTDLVQPIDWVTIFGISRTGSTAHVKGLFENTNVKQAVYSCELGIYAEDPDLGEILYGYTNAGTKGDNIPPISAGPFSREFQVNIAVGSASEVTAVISPSGFVTHEEFEDHTKNYSNPHKVTADQVGAAAKNHTHPNATQTTAGFMSPSDFSKLAGIQSGAINQTTADSLYAKKSGDTFTGDVKIDAGLTVRLRFSRSGLDSNGKFVTAEWRRKKDNTLFLKSVLSNPDSNGNYRTDTWSIYNAAGTSVVETVTWTIAYDADGNIISVT
ncbi:hypothetical protein NDK47_24010 [Brevibacillus ruminantium]|uniref:Phage tail protein n=1 Tax=Brevibacillus ruminantium TaxID=2950604 RepID=A0ABY4WDA1_9BACL|nr:hypothetical protein [Brevibacillus ruminantium]USG65151.1 hypothetical protein NDK47_24010 [Brevibacillus ruminantium]